MSQTRLHPSLLFIPTSFCKTSPYISTTHLTRGRSASVWRCWLQNVWIMLSTFEVETQCLMTAAFLNHWWAYKAHDTVGQNGGNFSGLLLVHVKIMYVVVKITMIWAMLNHWSQIGDLSPHWSNQNWCNTTLFNRHFDKIAYFQTMIYHTIIGRSVYKAKNTTILKVEHVRLRCSRWSFCIESKNLSPFQSKAFFQL